MSDVTRYRPTVTNVQATAYCGAHPDGEYVKVEDYDRLRAERDEARTEAGAWEATAQHHYKEARALEKRLAEAERDAARIEWLASNPRGGQIVVDGKTQDCVFWGISGHPRATLRDAIDAVRSTDSATPRENV